MQKFQSFHHYKWNIITTKKPLDTLQSIKHILYYQCSIVEISINEQQINKLYS